MMMQYRSPLVTLVNFHHSNWIKPLIPKCLLTTHLVWWSMLFVTAQTFCLTISQALIERKGKTFYDYIIVLTFDLLVSGDGILTTVSPTLR